MANISGSKAPFELIEDDSGFGKRTFIAKGAINAKSSEELRHKLGRCLGKGQNKIHINMSRVTFLSSSGIRVLLEMYKKTKKTDGFLKITSPAENVRNVIGMAALDELLF